jgi:Domain of unknown function (DUF6458)
MNRAASLTIIAVGAVFAFAITTNPTFLNLHVAGWILMITGACGLVLSGRSRDWLRRTVIVTGSPDISQTAEPPVESETTIEEYTEQ